jgi:hypothetical protein
MSDRMHNWIRLNPSALDRASTKHVDGIEITVGMAPHDLPEKVRGGYRDDIDRFVIEFRYLGPSEEARVRTPTQDSAIDLIVGHHSSRLYEIHVNTRAMGSPRVQLQVLVPKVESAINSLKRIRPNRIKNYEVANRVIDENRNLLFAGM